MKARIKEENIMAEEADGDFMPCVAFNLALLPATDLTPDE